MLTKQPFAYAHVGRNLYDNREEIGYDVLGLPVGEEAKISEVNRHWQILRITNGKSEGWTGEYPTADDALNALQAEFPNS